MNTTATLWTVDAAGFRAVVTADSRHAALKAGRAEMQRRGRNPQGVKFYTRSIQRDS